jgi:hypothetical protein
MSSLRCGVFSIWLSTALSTTQCSTCAQYGLREEYLVFSASPAFRLHGSDLRPYFEVMDGSVAVIRAL